MDGHQIVMLSKCVILIISYLRFLKVDFQTKLMRWQLFLNAEDKSLLLGVMLFHLFVALWVYISITGTFWKLKGFPLLLWHIILDSVWQTIKCCLFLFDSVGSSLDLFLQKLEWEVTKILNEDTTVESKKKAVVLWSWLTKALVLRNSKQQTTFTNQVCTSVIVFFILVFEIIIECSKCSKLSQDSFSVFASSVIIEHFHSHLAGVWNYFRDFSNASKKINLISATVVTSKWFYSASSRRNYLHDCLTDCQILV